MSNLQVHIHTVGGRQRIQGAASRILSTTHRKRKRLLQQRIDPEQIEFAHLFRQDPEQRNKESESKDENFFGIGESVDQIQNISSRILVKAGDRRLVLLRRQRLNSLPKSRSSEEINELENPELRVVVDGSSEKKEFTGITHANQPDREIQV